MLRFLLSFTILFVFSFQISAQVLDSAKIKTAKLDTVIKITQQDVDDYVLLRKIADTIGKQEGYLRIIKDVKTILLTSKIPYDRALQFSEQNEQLQLIYKAPITSADVSEYLLIRKIVGDTVGKKDDYLKIIKSAKFRVAQGKYMFGLYKEIDYENALKEAEENLRLRSLVDKILVIKSARKLYLYKDGKVLKTYPIALGFNPIGQKEREGDGKTPEGIYKIDYNTTYDRKAKLYSFHLSYPNEVDKARAKTKGLTPGSHIMIHGTSKGIKKRKDWTNGCIAISNTALAEFQSMVFTGTGVEIRK